MNHSLFTFDRGTHITTLGQGVADRKSLGIIGLIMSVVTAAVVVVGIIVVQGHLTGRYVLDRPVASLPI
jgi:hypothetical protein